MKKSDRSSAKGAATSGGKLKRSIDHPLAYPIPKSASSLEAVFGPRTFFSIECRLTNEDAIVTAAEIADAIEAHPNKRLPPKMREEVCKILRTARIKKKRGPKHSIGRSVQWLIATTYYDAALRQLQLDDSGKSRGRDSGRDPRHRQAAERAIREAGLGSITVETFLNHISQDRAKTRRRYEADQAAR